MLLERLRSGATMRARSSRLVARHGPMVLGVCRRFLRDPNDVEDAFQATYLIAVRLGGLAPTSGPARQHGSMGSPTGSRCGRLPSSARHRSATRHGRDVVERALDAEFRRRDSDSVLSRLDFEPGPWLHEEVRRLPEKYRTLVLLCYFEGLSHEQTAARIGCPIGTVKGRLARARDLLRRRLVRRGITLSAASLSGHLAGAGVRAAVPESLRYATCEAARAIAGTAGASLVVAPSVVLPVPSLTDGVLRAMIITQAELSHDPPLDRRDRDHRRGHRDRQLEHGSTIHPSPTSRPGRQGTFPTRQVRPRGR